MIKNIKNTIIRYKLKLDFWLSVSNVNSELVLVENEDDLLNCPLNLR
jgi:hypothetical protein